MEANIHDFLTKQVLIERNVITFRSLSRQFSLHVNTAKTLLATFYDATRGSSESLAATYMLTGEVAPVWKTRTVADGDGMDVDLEVERGDDSDGDEIVPLTKVTLVGERDIEAAKTQYLRIISIHIYSLSPASLADAALVCGPSEKVYQADAKATAELSVLLGKVVGSHVHKGKPSPLAAINAKAQTTGAQKPSTVTQKASKTIETSKEEPEMGKEDRPSLQPKRSGMLDWSKAKPKQKADQEQPKGKLKAKGSEKRQSMSGQTAKRPSDQETKAGLRSNTATDSEESKATVKRGTKRKSTPPPLSDVEKEIKSRVPEPTLKKSPATRKTGTRSDPPKNEPKTGRKRRLALAMFSDSEEDSPGPASTSAANSTKPKRAVILSDEEEEPRPASRSVYGRGKAQGKVTENTSPAVDKSLRAIMDIDDSEVIKASRPASGMESEVDDTQTEETEIVEDSEPERIKAKPRKKKAKKIVPVGKNGLKKKRVMKSRMRTDDRGYMVTEDYSSYESVDEEEVEEAVPAKSKGRKSSVKNKKISEATETKPKPSLGPKEDRATSKSGGGAKPGNRGNLMNFFGKAK